MEIDALIWLARLVKSWLERRLPQILLWNAKFIFRDSSILQWKRFFYTERFFQAVSVIDKEQRNHMESLNVFILFYPSSYNIASMFYNKL